MADVCQAIGPGAQVVTLRGGTAAKRAERAAAGLLQHVSDVHLALGAAQAPAGSVQSMGVLASTLLLAVCIRCGCSEPEGLSLCWDGSQLLHIIEVPCIPGQTCPLVWADAWLRLAFHVRFQQRREGLGWASTGCGLSAMRLAHQGTLCSRTKRALTQTACVQVARGAAPHRVTHRGHADGRRRAGRRAQGCAGLFPAARPRAHPRQHAVCGQVRPGAALQGGYGACAWWVGVVVGGGGWAGVVWWGDVCEGEVVVVVRCLCL